MKNVGEGGVARQINIHDLLPPQRPVWVVTLTIDWRRVKPESDTKYVRAATLAGAIRTAKANSFLSRNARAFARRATPQDLGCVPVGVAA